MKSTAQAVQRHLELDWIAASQGPLARPGIPQFHLKTSAVMRPGLRLWGFRILTRRIRITVALF